MYGSAGLQAGRRAASARWREKAPAELILTAVLDEAQHGGHLLIVLIHLIHSG